MTWKLFSLGYAREEKWNERNITRNMTRPTEHSNARPASWQRKEEFSLGVRAQAGIESDGGGGGDRAQFRVTHVHGRLSHAHSAPIPLDGALLIRLWNHPGLYTWTCGRARARTRSRCTVRWEWSAAARQCRSRGVPIDSQYPTISVSAAARGIASRSTRRKILWLLPHEAGDWPRFRLVLDYCQTAEPIWRESLDGMRPKHSILGRVFFRERKRARLYLY